MVYVALTLVVILSVYALGSYMLYTLPVVEAGSTSDISHTGLQRRSERVNSAYTKCKNENVYKYRRFVVQGNCMSKIGIHPNEIISVWMFKGSSVQPTLKEGMPVLIFLNDKNFRGYKIRVIKQINGDVVDTLYYDENGNEKISSKPHSRESIIGVVDMEETKAA